MIWNSHRPKSTDYHQLSQGFTMATHQRSSFHALCQGSFPWQQYQKSSLQTESCFRDNLTHTQVGSLPFWSSSLNHDTQWCVWFTWPALIQSVKALLLEKNMRSCCQREEDVDGEEEAGEEVEGEEVWGGANSSEEPRLGPSFCLSPSPAPWPPDAPPTLVLRGYKVLLPKI